MHFDGVANREGDGVGIWIISPKVGKSKLFSYKLFFYCTNNVGEYKALIFGLQNLKKLGDRIIVVYEDSKMVDRKLEVNIKTNALGCMLIVMLS